MPEQNRFHLNTSLAIVNSIGRSLYSDFETVVGEIISNSWDADACNVWIDFDSKKFNFAGER